MIKSKSTLIIVQRYEKENIKKGMSLKFGAIEF